MICISLESYSLLILEHVFVMRNGAVRRKGSSGSNAWENILCSSLDEVFSARELIQSCQIWKYSFVSLLSKGCIHFANLHINELDKYNLRLKKKKRGERQGLPKVLPSAALFCTKLKARGVMSGRSHSDGVVAVLTLSPPARFRAVPPFRFHCTFTRSLNASFVPGSIPGPRILLPVNLSLSFKWLNV